MEIETPTDTKILTKKQAVVAEKIEEAKQVLEKKQAKAV